MTDRTRGAAAVGRRTLLLRPALSRRLAALAALRVLRVLPAVPALRALASLLSPLPKLPLPELPLPELPLPRSNRTPRPHLRPRADSSRSAG